MEPAEKGERLLSTTAGVGVERGVAFAGGSVLHWFGQHGLVASAPSGYEAKVAADVLRGETISVVRIWHTPLELRRATSGTRRDGRRSRRMLLMLEGEMALTIDERIEVLGKGHSILLPESTELVLANDSPSARVEIQMDESLVLADQRAMTESVGRVNAPSGMSNVLAGLVTVVFSSGVGPLDQGWTHLARSIAEASTAVATHSLRSDLSLLPSSAEVRLYARALAVIEEKSVRSDFSVESLIEELRTSATRLRDAFAAHGTTPRDQLRTTRARAASRILDENNFTSLVDLERFAAATGFSSARTMRAGVARLRASPSTSAPSAGRP